MSIIDRTRNWRQLNRHKNFWNKYGKYYLLLLPTVVIFSLLWLLFLRGLWMSFHDWGFQGEHVWIGLENYINLFSWDPFYTSIRATILFAIPAVLLQTIFGVAAAVALANVGSRLIRNVTGALYLIAFSLPPVVSGLLWTYLMDPSFGPFFYYLQVLGVINDPVFWGSYGDLALTVVTGATIWTYWPMVFLIIYSSRLAIPDSHYEVAKVFGATRYQMLRNITLPQLKSAILIVVSLRIIYNLSKVSQTLTITKGGPGYSTSILGVLLYRQTLLGNLGRAYAVGIILFAITLIALMTFLRGFRAENATEGDS